MGQVLHLLIKRTNKHLLEMRITIQLDNNGNKLIEIKLQKYYLKLYI